MGQVAGYLPAEYLLQYASVGRRYERIPASLWDALLNHVRDSGDLTRLATSAADRLLYGYAIPYYRNAVAKGNGLAARQLADLLEELGDLEGAITLLETAAPGSLFHRTSVKGLMVQTLVDSGASRVANLLAERGDLDGLQVRADAGDIFSAGRLADVLAERGDLDGLRARGDAGDAWAAMRLADVLAERGSLDEAVEVVRRHATGNSQATQNLAVGVGNSMARQKLADLLAKSEDLNGLRVLADSGDQHARALVADLLLERRDAEGLRSLADSGETHAIDRLASLLISRGDVDAAIPLLHRHADADDTLASERLADLLAKRGDLAGLGARADAGDRHAAQRLVELLVERGNLDGLRQRIDIGDSYAAGRLADILITRGDLDSASALLQLHVNAGYTVAKRLADAFDDQADLQGLRVLVASGKSYYTADALYQVPTPEPINEYAASLLAKALTKQHDLEGLLELVQSGIPDAAKSMADVFIERGDRELANRLRRFGFSADAAIAAGPTW